MSAAEFSLYYTDEDNGIWISHGEPFASRTNECKWEHHVGIGLSPSVEEVFEAMHTHLEIDHPESKPVLSEGAQRIKETLTRSGIYKTPRPDVEVETPADPQRRRLIVEKSSTLLRDVAELIAGLAVPVSLGMGSDGLLGTAFEPWKRLYDRYGTAWASADEIEQRLREDFGSRG